MFGFDILIDATHFTRMQTTFVGDAGRSLLEADHFWHQASYLGNAFLFLVVLFLCFVFVMAHFMSRIARSKLLRLRSVCVFVYMYICMHDDAGLHARLFFEWHPSF